MSIAAGLTLLALSLPDSSTPLGETPQTSTQTLELSVGVDAPLLGASAAMLATALVLTQTHAPSEATGSTQSVEWFDRVALGRNDSTQDTVSTVMQNALVIGAPLTLALSQWSGHVPDLIPAFVVIESLVASTAVCQLTKSLAPRPRPYAYAHGTAAGEADRSFYSAHTTVSFAAVVSTFMVLDEKPPEISTALLIAALGVASSVGVLRVTSGRHFLSDVVVGALTGAAIGWVVPTLHRRDRPLSLIVSPTGLALTGKI